MSEAKRIKRRIDVLKDLIEEYNSSNAVNQEVVNEIVSETNALISYVEKFMKIEPTPYQKLMLNGQGEKERKQIVWDRLESEQ